MDKQPVVSVIVPVYNVEKYLDRCMESLVNQTEENIEIILVDDGSKDSSGSMCDTWAEKDSRVKVVHKQNAGLGYARNSGIEVATGEYIAYVDSDDYIDLVALEKAVARLKETNADVCYFGYVQVWEDRKKYGVPPQKLLYSGDETIEYVKNILGPPPESTALLFGGVSAWSGVVRRELLIKHHILFPSERECLCEDIFYNLTVCMHSHIIAVEPTCLYYYCHNDNNSLTLRYREDRFEAALRMYDKLGEMMKPYKGDKDISERLIRALMQNLIVCAKQEVVYSETNGKSHMTKMLKKQCEDKKVKEALALYPIHKMPIKQRFLFWAMKYRQIALTVLLVKMRMRA